jgi:uncharacterized protein (TIGR03118 family)
VQTRFVRGCWTTAALAAASLAFAGTARAASNQYVVHNIVSSNLSLVPADRADVNLVNPWGLVSSPTSPWWPANNGSNTLTIVPATGAVNSTVVQAAGGPTGIVWNGTSTAFPITGGAASFIADTEDGHVLGWRSGTAALTTPAVHAGAVYKGLALAQTANGPQLYATDFHNGKVDVYNSQWVLQTAPSFNDPNLPAGYAPYGIQTVGSRIFVTYAKQDAAAHDELAGAGIGAVDVFDTAGTLIGRVATGGTLNAPWGIALAPTNFGSFAGDVLIGNFGDGRINAFKEGPAGTFTPDGTLQDAATGAALSINGLWALEFGSGAANNGSTNTLFFTAGPFGEAAGVFGRISANPSSVGGTVPATLSLTLGPPASFGPFTPGVAKDYAASTTATVISTAGDGALSVADPSSTATGHLVNGSFSLPQALQADATSAGGTGGAFAPVGGSAAPTLLLTYTGPVSNDAVTVNFKQSIGSSDALRTGTYSKTLTFTLSTTTP